MNSLTFLCSQLLLLTGSGAISPCCAMQSVEHGTPSIQGCKKASVKVGKKVAVRREPSPTAASTGIFSDTLAGDPAFLRAGNALPSCHPDTPGLPQQAVFYWFHCRFHCQNSLTRASSLWGPCAMCTVPNPHPGQSALGQVLGE